MMRATCHEGESIISVCLLKEASSGIVSAPECRSNVLPLGGQSEPRQEYLEKHVLEFRRPENRDAFNAMPA